MLNERENFIATARLGKSEYGLPQYIPIEMHINHSMWAVYKKDLEEIVLRHPVIFTHEKGSLDFDNMAFSTQTLDEELITDEWGCVWKYPLRYMDGVVVGHPLADFSKIEDYEFPTPPFSTRPSQEAWAEELKQVSEQKAAGNLVSGYTDHGIMLLRHTYLRGFENAMLDYVDEVARLSLLLNKITEYYLPLVDYNIKRGADIMRFQEDLGTQTSSLISPSYFERWIAPAYERLMKPCRDAGILTWLHSDGYILELVDILNRFGVDIINAQDLCNGIDNLAKNFKGRMCIDLDIDRQTVIPFGTPKDIDDLIREEVMKLGSPAGGLMFKCGLYPPTPLENVHALANALEKYKYYWWQ